MLVLVLDTTRRSAEVDELLVRVEASQVTVGLAERKLSSMQQYVRPVLSSAGPSSPTGTDLTALVVGVGAEGSQRVAEERSAVQEARILPWHTGELAARASYLDYLDAKSAHLVAAGSGDRAVQDAKRRVDRARADAVAALSAVVSGTDDVTRIEEALTGPWS